MLAAGLHNTTFPPEVDPFNFAPLATIPVLMLDGHDYWIFPVNVSQDPLYRALGSKDKKLLRYDCGHGLTPEAYAAAIDWLDERLKPAAQ